MFVKSHPKIDKISAKYEICDDTINLFGSSTKVLIQSTV